MRGLVLSPRHHLEHNIKLHRKQMECEGVGQSRVAGCIKRSNESLGSTIRAKLYTSLLIFSQAERQYMESVQQTQPGRHMM
jgi:hypothetical protein